MEVEFWKTWSGRSPVYKFLENQSSDASARIMKDLDHLKKQGLRLLINPNKLKSLTGYKDLYELKTDFRGVFYRIIFCTKHDKAYLLEAFKKKSNDTKADYIDKALKRQQSLN